MNRMQKFLTVPVFAATVTLSIVTVPSANAEITLLPSCEQGYTAIQKTDQWGDVYWECPTPPSPAWGNQPTPPPAPTPNPNNNPGGGTPIPSSNDCNSSALIDDNYGDFGPVSASCQDGAGTTITVNAPSGQGNSCYLEPGNTHTYVTCVDRCGKELIQGECGLTPGRCSNCDQAGLSGATCTKKLSPLPWGGCEKSY